MVPLRLAPAERSSAVPMSAAQTAATVLVRLDAYCRLNDLCELSDLLEPALARVDALLTSTA